MKSFTVSMSQTKEFAGASNTACPPSPCCTPAKWSCPIASLRSSFVPAAVPGFMRLHHSTCGRSCLISLSTCEVSPFFSRLVPTNRFAEAFRDTVMFNFAAALCLEPEVSPNSHMDNGSGPWAGLALAVVSPSSCGAAAAVDCQRSFWGASLCARAVLFWSSVHVRWRGRSAGCGSRSGHVCWCSRSWATW